MATKSNYEKGNQFEIDFAKRLGGMLQPGSGNQWYAKLDVKGKSFLWSLKSTTAPSFRIHKDILRECIHAIIGPGGVGGDTMPGVALRIDDEDYVLLRADDFLNIVENDIKISSATAKKVREETAKISKFERNLQGLGVTDGSTEKY